MSASSRNLAPGAISSIPGLPSIFIEKVKILPTDFAAEEQEIEVTFSLQSKVSTSDLTNGRYMVFVAFGHHRGQIQKLLDRPDTVKHLISSPSLNPPTMEKHYLKVNKSALDVTRGPLDSKSHFRYLYSKQLACTYKCPLKSLKDLFLYAVPYKVDTQAISKSGVDRKIKAMKIGTPVAETVMKNGKTGLTTAVYTFADTPNPEYGKKGQVWAGPVNAAYSAKGSLLLASKALGRWNWDEDHPRLNQQIISNQKVIDLRFLNDIKNLSFTSSEEKLKTLSSKQRKDLEKIKKVVKVPGQISDCSYSRTPDNAIRGIFSMDYDRLAKERTRLGRFIQNKNALASCFQIENIRVFRTRVDPVSLEPNDLTPGRISPRGANATIAPETFVGSLADGTVKSIDVQSSRSSIRTLVISDDSLGSTTMGSYEYKIIVDMVDMSVSAISHIARTLPRFLSAYNKYISLADKSGTPGANVAARMKRNATRMSSASQSWKKLINSYMTAIEFIYGPVAFGTAGSLVWRKNLIAMANPANADIKSIQTVYEIINNFNTNLQRVFKVATKGNDDTPFNARSKISAQSSGRRHVVIEHIFRSNYEAKTTFQEGTDYLDNDRTTNNEGNLTNISYQDYEFRIVDEMNKFEVPRPNAPGVNKYGFLSPWRLNTHGSSVDVYTKFMPEEAGNGVLSSNLNPNAKIMSLVRSNSNDDVFDVEVEDLLAVSDVSLTSPRRSLKEILAHPEPVKEKTSGVGKFLNNIKITKDIVDTKAAISGSQAQKIKRSKPRKKAIKKSPLAKRIVSARAFNFRKLPRPIFGSAGLGSLAIAALQQEPSNVDNNSSFGNSINFNSLMEVQYFDGYRMVDGALNLNAPLWRTLNQAKFKQFQEKDESVLCRLQSVTKAFKIPSNYSLPGYENLFILGNREPAETSINYAGGTYLNVIDNIYAALKNDSKNVALNIEDRAAATLPAYTKSPSSLTIRRVPAPPQVAGAVSAKRVWDATRKRWRNTAPNKGGR